MFWIKTIAGAVFLAVVGIYFFATAPTAQFSWTKVDVLSDADQGYTKYIEETLPGSGNATTSCASSTGYWFHRIGIMQIATHSHATTCLTFMIRPYATTNDSTSIVATYATVTFPPCTGATVDVGGVTHKQFLNDQYSRVEFPLKCTKFTLVRIMGPIADMASGTRPTNFKTTPEGGSSADAAWQLWATQPSVNAAFRWFGYQKNHN